MCTGAAFSAILELKMPLPHSLYEVADFFFSWNRIAGNINYYFNAVYALKK